MSSQVIISISTNPPAFSEGKIVVLDLEQFSIDMSVLTRRYLQGFENFVIYITDLIRQLFPYDGIERDVDTVMALRNHNHEAVLAKVYRMIRMRFSSIYELVMSEPGIDPLVGIARQRFSRIYDHADMLRKEMDKASRETTQELVKLRAKECSEDFSKIKDAAYRLQYVQDKEAEELVWNTLQYVIDKLKASIYTRDMLHKHGTNEESTLEWLYQNRLKL